MICPCPQSKLRTCSKSCNRSGRRRPKRPAAFGCGSRLFFPTRRSPAIAAAKTRRAGAEIWSTSWRLNPRSRKGSAKTTGRLKHFKALSYAELPAFMAELRNNNSISARALEWTILTAARTNETLGATFAEIDLGRKTWTIPGNAHESRARAHRPAFWSRCRTSRAINQERRICFLVRNRADPYRTWRCWNWYAGR